VQVPGRVDGLVLVGAPRSLKAGQPVPTRWIGSPSLSIPAGSKSR
jgi:hypothetical protein